MSWDTLFSIANLYALICWVALAFLPRWPALLAAILYAGVGLLCLTYAVSLIGFMTGMLDAGGGAGGGDFSSIEGVRTLFASDAGITIGWVHYLAFDLFVGLWIARDADAKGFNRIIQVPVLFFTLMAGPLGLLIWLVIREKRAQAQGRWS
ncbi:ABA4-like family protein [Altererythrobacter sp. GH1-8]|uniref:ABA4-like family protein n=1 Tax=Altererythrobacter sp. GH1-8 TaxID=3349333 RepID=UPI00374D2FCC